LDPRRRLIRTAGAVQEPGGGGDAPGHLDDQRLVLVGERLGHPEPHDRNPADNPFTGDHGHAEDGAASSGAASMSMLYRLARPDRMTGCQSPLSAGWVPLITAAIASARQATGW
jgi:hypothetical protein